MRRYLIVVSAAVVLTALSALVYGYQYGLNPNHIQVLPFIEKIKDPSLFPSDYFVNTLGRFPSVYPYLMAFLSRWIDLAALHLICYAIFKTALLVLAYMLARLLFRSEKTAIVAMFLFAFSPLINAYGILGHDPLMKTSFYQTSASAPLALAAILMFLKRRFFWASIILAAIYYINALIGNFLIALFFFAAAYKYIYKVSVTDLKKMLYSLLIFIALMIPAVIWVARVNVASPAVSSENFPLFLKLWYTGHYFPSFFTGRKWYYFSLVLLFFIIFFRKGLGHVRESGIIKAFLSAFVFMWVAAAFFGEVLTSRSLILLQLLRSDVLFIAFGLIFAADYIRRLLEGRSVRETAVAGLIILALIEFSKPTYAEFMLVALILTEFRPQIGRIVNLRFIWVLFAVFLVTYSAISLFGYKASPKMGCMLFFSLALFLGGERVIPGRFKNSAAVAVLAVALLSYIHIFEYRFSTGDFSNVFDQRSADWKNAQLWAKENTTKDSVFIVPLEMNGFRVFSDRQVFVDWVDGAAMHWVPGFEHAWVERLGKMGLTRDIIDSNAGWICGLGSPDIKVAQKFLYAHRTEEDFKQIKTECGADYVIEDAARPLSFKEVYRNSTFRVYRIG